jgi:hypothetical protein
MEKVNIIDIHNHAQVKCARGIGQTYPGPMPHLVIGIKNKGV